MIEKCIAKAEAKANKIGKIDGDPIKLLVGKEAIFRAIMMQLSLKADLKNWEKWGEDSTLMEMAQLHDLEAFFPRDPDEGTTCERLSSRIFLKEKASGEKNSRTCINKAPQQDYIKKEDVASSTASTDEIFIVKAMNAYKN